MSRDEAKQFRNQLRAKIAVLAKNQPELDSKGNLVWPTLLELTKAKKQKESKYMQAFEKKVSRVRKEFEKREAAVKKALQ